MNNKKMLLPALLSIALVFSLILPVWAAGASANVPLPDDHSIGFSQNYAYTGVGWMGQRIDHPKC